MTNDKPGKKAIHHSPENKKLLPILINVPNDACVAANPTPRNDKVDSIRIENAKPIVAITKTGLITFLNMCLTIIICDESPMTCDA